MFGLHGNVSFGVFRKSRWWDSVFKEIVKVAKTLRPEAFHLTSLTMGDLRWKENPFCCFEPSFTIVYWMKTLHAYIRPIISWGEGLDVQDCFSLS